MLQYVMQKTIIAFLQKPPVVSSDEIVIIVIYGSSEAELPSRISLLQGDVTDSTGMVRA